MLKLAQSVCLSASLIKTVYDLRHRGVATSQQHSSVATNCVGVLGTNSLGDEETGVRQVNYDLQDISPEAMVYLEETLATRYKNWKSDLHAHFKLWDDSEIARLEGCPAELEGQPEDWDRTNMYIKKSVAGKKARESKTLLHHSGSNPFSYRLEAQREEGSKFPEIDLFMDVYIRPGNETTKQLHATMVEKHIVVLQEATSQLPPEIPIEDVIVPEDADRSHERSIPLKEEVTTLKGQLAAQGEQMSMIVRDLQMSDLQIPMLALDLSPPSTSQPLRLVDTH
ncbi:unnamed protein product [Malus baccata var. baccata]